ncbi:MAG: hypothetical protein ACE5KJ_06975, partial [Candidatus Zixiibacteriota bacterium]
MKVLITGIADLWVLNVRAGIGFPAPHWFGNSNSRTNLKNDESKPLHPTNVFSTVLGRRTSNESFNNGDSRFVGSQCSCG